MSETTSSNSSGAGKRRNKKRRKKAASAGSDGASGDHVQDPQPQADKVCVLAALSLSACVGSVLGYLHCGVFRVTVGVNWSDCVEQLITTGSSPPAVT